MITTKAKKTIRFTIIVVGLIAALFITSTILIRPIVEKTLRKEIENLLKGVYHFDFEKVNINLLTGSLSLQHLSLTPCGKTMSNTREQENLYTIQIKKIQITGLSYLPFFKKKLNIEKIEIIDPVVSISNGKNKSRDSTKTLNFYSLIENKIKELDINHIHISGGRMQLMKPDDSKNIRFSIRNFSATLSNLKIDSAIAAKNEGWPNWENLIVRSVSNHYLLPDKRHQLDIPALSWSDKDCVLVISKIHFYEKASAADSKLSIQVKELRGEKIDLQAMLKGQIKINKILMTQPVTHIVIPSTAPSQKVPNVENILIQNFPQTEIAAISIVKGELSFENQKKKYKVYIHEFNHSYDSIQINVTNARGSEFARPGIKFDAGSIKIVFPDSMYVLTGEKLKVGKTKDEVTIANVALNPQYDKKEFSRKRGIQEERWVLKFPLLKLSGIDIYDILLEQKIVASNVEIPNISLYAYRDKNYPAVNKIKLLPAVLLMQMDEYIKIDFLKIGSADIVYEEKLPGNKGLNKIFFTEVQAKIYNITNDKKATAQPMRIVASGLIYGKGYIQAKAVFQLRNRHGNFFLSGSSGAFDMRFMNAIVESSASLSVKRGQVDSMTFDMQGNDTLAKGPMHLFYHDLKLNVLNRRTSSKHGLKAEVGTFLIDKMLVKSENPAKNGEIKVGEIYYEMDKYTSIFTMLAKSLLSGVLSTVAPAVSEIKKKKNQ